MRCEVNTTKTSHSQIIAFNGFNLKDSVRAKHTEKLHNASHQNIADIISTCDDLETFIKSKRDIKKTEVEDNESIEQQCIEQFLKNTDRIHDKYVQVLTELQNVLCEKHDTTFYKLYTAIDKDITCLDDIPKAPTFPTVPSVDKKMLCKEILEYIQSKTDMSLCQNCTNLEDKLIEILEEKERTSAV
ncbi:unnamed protein product [Mytilus edulis]|uniref:Uncharacterized protein n=1 Tax=Mytilus edulis TaxID=6550 RepID=A0A8S3S998_MYTED|nr:unnamed protein product [Mytilus edulis]